MVDAKQKAPVEVRRGETTDDVATFDVQEKAAREAHSAGTGTYLYEHFHDRAVALHLPEDRLGKLKRAWQYSLNNRQEEIKPTPPKPAEDEFWRNWGVAKPAIKRSREPSWPEAPKPPEEATPEERLTYPPGLLGHVVQQIYEADPLRNRNVALMTALSGLGKVCDRKIIGPTGNSTVLFNLLLGLTGIGKQHSFGWLRRTLTAIGYNNVIVSQGLASVQSIEEILQGRYEDDVGQPSVLVPIDEYGSFLSRISTKNQSGNVSEIPATLQTLWGWPPNEEWKGTAKVGKTKIVPVYGPAFAITGTSTDRSFFGAVKAKQVSGGFINRHQYFIAGRNVVRRAKLDRARGECPEWLSEALKGVIGPPAPYDNRPQYFVRRDGSRELMKGGLREIPFGEGVEDLWYDWDYELRKLMNEDEDKYELWARTAEMALRDGTICGTFHNGEIDREVYDWAKALATQSTTLLEKGLHKYMFEDLNAAEACHRLRKEFVKRLINPLPRRRPGEMTSGEIRKFLESKIDIRQIPYVLNQLLSCGDIAEVEGSGPGRPTEKYRWLCGVVKFDEW